jgi:putative heme-binding domain-containing protein
VRIRRIIGAIVIVLCVYLGGAAQTASLDDSPPAVQEGLQVYRAHCARCHDLNAQGYRGRDLTQPSKRAQTNAQLTSLITQGIAGTEMPATKLDALQLSHLIAYLQSLHGPARVERGDPARGGALFWGKAQCGQCHMVSGRGGRLGPELTFIGAVRSKAFLVRELRTPSEYVGKGYDTVVVTTVSGEQIRGVRKNEDAFSIQMMDVNENIRVFLKKDLREVMIVDESLMPAYGPDRLNDAEFDDLLRYLASLR